MRITTVYNRNRLLFCFRSKRMSKVKTLQLAIEYINQLQGVLSLQNSPVHNHVSF